MIRTINIVLLFTSLLALIAVYALKYSVEETAGKRLALQSNIEKQEADLSMLKADWAYLTQPAHIDPIVKRHSDVLELAILDQKQIATIDAIAALPMRPMQVPNTEALDDLFESLDLGIDPIDGETAPLIGEPQRSAVDMGAAMPSAGSAPVPMARSVRPAAPPPAPSAPAFDPLAALIEESEG